MHLSADRNRQPTVLQFQSGMAALVVALESAQEALKRGDTGRCKDFIYRAAAEARQIVELMADDPQLSLIEPAGS